MNFTNMAENLKNALSQGLPIMLAGMVGIFIVTVIIILAISILSKVSGSADGYFSKGVKALFSKKK